jgi:uncharacterized membrane protein
VRRSPPSDRVLAFDLARGLAVFFMILIHVMRHWGEPSTWTTPIGVLASFLGGPPAAPVFMFLMGASVAFSRRSSFRPLAMRGLGLFALAYVFNVFRGALPLTLGLASGIVTSAEVAPHTPGSLLTMVDILQLAGLSLIGIAALRRFARPGWSWLAFAAVVVLAAPFLRGVTVGNPVIDGFLSVFWGAEGNVYYPVFPWAVFPLAGAVLGERLALAPDRSALLGRVGLAGIAVCAVGIVGVIGWVPTLSDTTYWHLPPALALAILGFVLVWIAACDQVVRRVPRARVVDVVYGWSARVQAMYITHWLLVGWGVGLVGFQTLGLAPVLVLMGVVVVLTSQLTAAYPVLAARLGLRPLRRGTSASPAAFTTGDRPT